MEIDTSKLEPGMKVKNYKELCGLLGVPVLSGSSKPRQVKKFEQYFTYHKFGREIIIDEIYPEGSIKLVPAKRTDKRFKDPRNIYQKYMINIILQSLNQSENHCIQNISKQELSTLVGLTDDSNSIYYDYKFTDEEWNEITLSHGERTAAVMKINSIFQTCFEMMQHKGLISIEKVKRGYYTITLTTKKRIINMSDSDLETQKEYLHEDFVRFLRKKIICKEDNQPTDDQSN